MEDRRTAQSEDAHRLKARLRHQLRWLRLRLVGHALLMLGAGVGLVLAAAVLTRPGWSGLGPVGAWIVWTVVALAVAWIVFFEIVRPLRRVANLKGFSRELERHGGFDNMLEAATQFTSPKREDPLRRGASADLVAEILRRANAAAQATRLAPRVPLIGVGTNVAAAALALVVWMLLGAVAMPRVDATFASLFSPSRLSQAPPREGIYAVSRDLRVPVGGEVKLVARDFIGGDEPVLLEVNTTGDFWQQRATEVEKPGLDPAPYLDAVAEMQRVQDPFRYRFRKGTLVTAVHEVAIRERPVLTRLSLTLTPPAYSGRETVERIDPSGTISVLEGTVVALEGTASAPLQSAERRVEDGETTALRVDGDRLFDEFTVDQDLRFRLGLVDAEGLPNQALTLYHFLAEADDPPTVQITAPAEDRNLDRGLTVDIAGIAADDVGLARLDLVFRTELETEWSQRPLWTTEGPAAEGEDLDSLLVDRGEQDLAVAFRWDVGDLELLPGDALLYALEATDNDDLEGGQVSRSRIYRLRLPTIAEVFDIEREDRAEDGTKLQDLLAQGEDLRDDLERLDRELKKNPDPDWAKQQEIRETLERQAELREQLKDTAQEMQQQLQDFERNNSGSMELLEKMETVQELLKELRDDESLQAYLEAMKEAMDQLQPHEIQRQMEDSLADQEEYNRRLDRTIELLKQLERERTMSDLVEEVSEYLNRQDELAELTNPEQPQDQAQGEDQEQGENQDPNQDQGEQGDQTEQSENQDQQGEPQDQQGEESQPDQGDPSESEESQQGMDEEELARAQEKLAEEARQLEERIREALEKLKAEQESGESSDPAAQEMKEALEQALEQMEQEGKSSESMKEAAKDIAESNRQKAQESQKEARSQLLHLYEVLAEGMEGMQQASGEYAFEKLQQTAYDLLNLSFSEEKLVDALRDGIRGQQMRPITREQGRITRGASRLSDDLHDLANKNFNISERLLGEMRELVELLEDSVDEMQLSRSRRSRDTAVDTMAKMNRIVINLLTAAQNSQGGGQGSGQPSPSQQMQQMTQDQQRLNGMTKDLQRKMQQGFSESERRQLAEMRARQQAIREQLEEMRGQVEDERRILGDLDELSEQMERVENDLGEGHLNEDLTDQQEKILSRLLDAQRSVRERDFAKRRESRGTEELFREQLGGERGEELAEQERALRRWLAPEKAPHVYQEDVRRYFRKIQGDLDGQRGGGSR